MIQRYEYEVHDKWTSMGPREEGKYVLYSDHRKAIEEAFGAGFVAGQRRASSREEWGESPNIIEALAAFLAKQEEPHA